MRRMTATLFLLLLAPAPASSRAADAADAAVGDPRRLFAGHSIGNGALRLGLGRARTFRVESHGRMLRGGAFRLDQTVTFARQAPRTRHWILRKTAPGRFTFTLSDAAGPGVATIDGDRLVLRYPLGKGLSMRQVLVPGANGRAIDNRGTIHWLGIPVGELSETIERVQTPPSTTPVAPRSPG